MSVFGKDREAFCKFSESMALPEFHGCSFNSPKPLPDAKVAIVTTAALHREDGGFELGDSDYHYDCLLYTSPSPRDMRRSRMPSSA